jgi:glycine dehydrogenase subunit 1
MPFIPHTDADIQEMLKVIGAKSTEDLFDEIPQELRCNSLDQIPTGMTEMELTRMMRERALQDIGTQCFIGAGAYEHHIPAAVWDVASRGEFMTAYTPYQAEASQGTLQLIYEYQTMMASLMGLDVSNASLYDGASALAEAILMAVRVNRSSKSHRILLPKAVNPIYRKVAKTLIGKQGIVLEEIPYCPETGQTLVEALGSYSGDDITAVVIPQPNFFGVLEEVDDLTDWAHEQGALVIAVVNPIAMAAFKEPGQWGIAGADIACGEGQSLGVPLASGGPYYGFLCCKQPLVRQMPGRIVGKTIDLDGKVGFALTLQAREQHIRRSKATSNICTNQGLAVTASTIYMSILGFAGLRDIALASHQHTQTLLAQLKDIPGVEIIFTKPFFHEAVIRLPMPVETVLSEMAARGIAAGYALNEDYPELGNALLVCVTETKNNADLDKYVKNLREVLAN